MIAAARLAPVTMAIVVIMSCMIIVVATVRIAAFIMMIVIATGHVNGLVPPDGIQ